MAITCLRWTAVGLLSYAVNEFFVNLMLGVGRHKQVHVFTIFERFIYAVACAYVLGFLFGIEGVLASFSVAEMCFTVHILIHVWVKNKKIPNKLEHFLLLPRDFGVAPDMTLNYNISSMDEVVGVSGAVMDFCHQKGIDHRRAYFAALCTEEMASNIVHHGFSPDKPQSLKIRILIVNDDLILRFRDSCRLFNIREYYDSADRKDITKNIGIRMVMRSAKDVMYVNALNLNTTIIKL
jgi:anti-sigma regulatory factor (Ser/Thr protein kinase)